MTPRLLAWEVICAAGARGEVVLFGDGQAPGGWVGYRVFCVCGGEMCEGRRRGGLRQLVVDAWTARGGGGTTSRVSYTYGVSCLGGYHD